MATASLESRVFLTGDTEGALRALFALGAECSKQSLLRVQWLMREDLRAAQTAEEEETLRASLGLIRAILELRGHNAPHSR